jgi:hypothetical protein
MTTTTTLLCFDFDGVLAIPNSDPECLFPEVATILRELARSDYKVVVLSKNPRAWHVMKPLWDEGVITAIRAGSVQRWWEEGDGVYSDALHRQVPLNKKDFIASILSEHAVGRCILHVFDDDQSNLDDVAPLREHVAVETLHLHFIEWYVGLGRELLKRIKVTPFDKLDELQNELRATILRREIIMTRIELLNKQTRALKKENHCLFKELEEARQSSKK